MLDVLAHIHLLPGDITLQRVDAIVNAANPTLLGGGGVDGAIHAAAGPHLLQECQSLPEVRPGVRCPTGEARLTRGYNLPAPWVIHTAGPVWRGGDHQEDDLLARCYRNTLKLAADHKLNSVAFPAISTGVYGFPPQRAARIAVGEAAGFLHSQARTMQIIFVCFNDQALHAHQRALAEAKSAEVASC